MSDLDDCRRLLGDPALSDAEVADIRDALDAFARTLIDGFVRAGCLPTNGIPQTGARNRPGAKCISTPALAPSLLPCSRPSPSSGSRPRSS